MLLLPARERGQPQPPRDDPVDMLEQQHLGEQILILGARLQLAHCFIADPKELFAWHGVLVFWEPVQDELLILLLERARLAPQRRNAGVGRPAEGQGSQHGSTCTVTSSSSSSFLSFFSTAYAIAWAAATLHF